MWHLTMARLAGVALLLTAEVGAAARPVTVLSQLGAESEPSTASTPVTPMIRVSLDADARAPLSKLAAARYIRPSLDRGVAVTPLAPLPHRLLRQRLDATPEASSWFGDARAPVAPESASSAPDDSWQLTTEESTPRPKRHIRVDLSDAPGQIATPLPARRLRLRLD